MIPEENSCVSQSECRDELKHLANKLLTKKPQIPSQNPPQKSKSPKGEKEEKEK